MESTIGLTLLFFIWLLLHMRGESAEDKAKREDKERRIKYMQEASWFYDEFFPAPYGAGKLPSGSMYYNEAIKGFRKEYKDLCLRALAVDERDYEALEDVRAAVEDRYYS